MAAVVVGALVAMSTSLAIGACSDSSDGTSEGDGGLRGPDGEILDEAGNPIDEAGNPIDGAKTDGPAGDTSTPPTGNSCAGLPATCGGSKDCCASNVVPGGTFNRSSDPAYPATVSEFKLDVFEVTVGRFRNFVNAGKGTQGSAPAPGAGANPKIPSSGWDASFNTNLAASTADLKVGLACNPGYPAWSDAPGANENKPINCVTWYDALAFCAWDGGWLPTEAEWNFAAAGGNEHREYPWGSGIDTTRASYDCGGDGSGTGAPNCAFTDMLPVGSKPAGDGKWGQSDLGGNVWEWTLDWARTPYRLTSCTDCADLQTAPNKTFRGGGFPNENFYLTTATRIDDVATDRDYDVGFRCARSP